MNAVGGNDPGQLRIVIDDERNFRRPANLPDSLRFRDAIAGPTLFGSILHGRRPASDGPRHRSQQGIPL
jgi:hypothetical protein